MIDTMSKTYTEIQSEVEERLQPPISMKNARSSSNQKIKAKEDPSLLFPSAMLLRSASLDRIRQFPAYICSASSDFRWLFSSKSAFSQAIAISVKQLNVLLLTIFVYIAITVLLGQLIILSAFLAQASLIPLGLIFMCSCILVISSIAFTSILSFRFNHKCSKN